MADWIWNTLDCVFNPLIDWIMETDKRRMTVELAVLLFFVMFLYLLIIAPYILH